MFKPKFSLLECLDPEADINGNSITKLTSMSKTSKMHASKHFKFRISTGRPYNHSCASKKCVICQEPLYKYFDLSIFDFYTTQSPCIDIKMKLTPVI